MAKTNKLVMAGILLLLVMPFVLAIPQLPHQIYGSISINGEDIPDGVVISGLCDGDTYQTMTSGGNFGYAPDAFFIEDPYGGRAGETIEIYVNNAKVEELDFTNGELSELIIELSELPAYCNDGICSGGETCSTCPGDCGVCPPAPSSDGGGGGGGGGSSSSAAVITSTCVENWVCTEWSEITGACGTRTCTDSNKCETIILKPTEKRDCEEKTEETIVEADIGQQQTRPGITGAVIGALDKAKIPGIIIFIILIVGVLIYVNAMRKKQTIEK